MTDKAYLFLQLFLIIALSYADGLTALLQHPEWFQ
jgi:hypothetical protein